MVKPPPIVYWSQDADLIALKIDVSDVQDPWIDVSEKRLKFSAVGIARQRPNNFRFEIGLYSLILAVDPDCDTVLLQGDDDSDIDNENIDLYRKFQLEGYMSLQDFDTCHKDESKKNYLSAYFISLFVGYSFLIAAMGQHYAEIGFASVPHTYETIGPGLKFLQLIQLLEVIHPFIGYDNDYVQGEFLEYIGKMLMLFLFLEGEIDLQTKPVIFYLFGTWSLLGLIRYSYKLAKHYNVAYPVLNWARIAVLILLYPFNYLCEIIIVLSCMPYYEDTGLYSISLPNEWNFTFYLPYAMIAYLIFLAIPIICSILRL